MRCPAGALHFERTDGGSAESIPDENIILLDENGPLFIRGNIEVQKHDGEILLKDTRISLCHCGASNHKPFCDGLHTVLDFKNAGQILSDRKKLDREIPKISVLKIILQPNGPLMLSGPFKIKDAVGNIGFVGSRAALCRCGASKNKPFCDGSHVKIGFRSA